MPQAGPLLLSSAAAPALTWLLLFSYDAAGAGGAWEMMAGLGGALLFSPAAVLLGFVPALLLSAPLLGVAGWIVPRRFAGLGYAAAGALAGGAYSGLAWLMSKQYPAEETPPADAWLGTFVISAALYADRSGGAEAPPGWYLLSIAPAAGLLAGLLYWSRLRR
jgi:hypothetical protein